MTKKADDEKQTNDDTHTQDKSTPDHDQDNSTDNVVVPRNFLSALELANKEHETTTGQDKSQVSWADVTDQNFLEFINKTKIDFFDNLTVEEGLEKLNREINLVKLPKVPRVKKTLVLSFEKDIDDNIITIRHYRQDKRMDAKEVLQFYDAIQANLDPKDTNTKWPAKKPPMGWKLVDGGSVTEIKEPTRVYFFMCVPNWRFNTDKMDAFTLKNAVTNYYYDYTTYTLDEEIEADRLRYFYNVVSILNAAKFESRHFYNLNLQIQFQDDQDYVSASAKPSHEWLDVTLDPGFWNGSRI